MRFNARIKDRAVAYLRVVLNYCIIENYTAFSEFCERTYIRRRIDDIREIVPYALCILIDLLAELIVADGNNQELIVGDKLFELCRSADNRNAVN